MTSAQLALFDGEIWLAHRLGQHGVECIFGGDTNPAERKRRMRELITSRGLEQVICGHKERKPVRYAEAFERLYGEPLNHKPTRTRTQP